jgi:hypothetical protein
MEQTAVEWFTNQLEKHYVFQDIKNTTAFLHAKEMEKKQIIDAFWNGDNIDCISEQNIKEFAEKYYSETYEQ